MEQLPDKGIVWQRFGSFIMDEFKRCMNSEVLLCNVMMTGVEVLV
jgi:hypothetical protein